MDPHQANLQPNLLLLGSRLCFNPTPTSLGVTFDRTVFFLNIYLCWRANSFHVSRPYAVFLLPHGAPLRARKESFSLLYKAFLQPLLNYASPGWLPFLSVTNFTKLERLHWAASRAITCCLSSSPIPLLLRDFSTSPTSHFDSLYSVFFMSGLFVSQPYFPFQVWPDLEWNQDSADRPGELLRPLTRSCFLLLALGRLLLLALPVLPGIFLPSRWSPPFPLHALFLIPLLQGAALAHFDSLPPHDLVLWTDGSVPFPFGKGGSGVLANCSLCGTEATPFSSAGPVCSSFSAEACAILHALCWSRQHQQVCHFSFPSIWLSFCPRHSVLSSIFPLISNSIEDLAGTVFSLLLFYQATMGPRTLVSPGEGHGWQACQTGSATCALRNSM